MSAEAASALLYEAEARYLATLDALRHAEGLRITVARAERERFAAGEPQTCAQTAESCASIVGVVDRDEARHRADQWLRECRIAYLRALS